MHFCRVQERREDRPGLSAALVAAEQTVLFSDADRSDRSLHGVGVRLQPTVVEERRQPLPALEHVVDRLDQRRLAETPSFTASSRGLQALPSAALFPPDAPRGVRRRRGRGCVPRSRRRRAMRSTTSLAKGEFVVLWTFTKLRRA